MGDRQCSEAEIWGKPKIFNCALCFKIVLIICPWVSSLNKKLFKFLISLSSSIRFTSSWHFVYWWSKIKRSFLYITVLIFSTLFSLAMYRNGKTIFIWFATHLSLRYMYGIGEFQLLQMLEIPAFVSYRGLFQNENTMMKMQGPPQSWNKLSTRNLTISEKLVESTTPPKSEIGLSQPPLSPFCKAVSWNDFFNPEFQLLIFFIIKFQSIMP